MRNGTPEPDQRDIADTPVPGLGKDMARALDRDGFLHLRGAVPDELLAPLCAAFEAGTMPSERWPVPRGPGWRHSQLDLDAHVQRLCRLGLLLGAAAQLIGGRFFLSQVEGREPLATGGAQTLHRDSGGETRPQAIALVYLDRYGADNGATRLVAASHRGAAERDDAVTLAGEAGDVLIFHPELLHGATCNHSGERRRSLLIGYAHVDLGEDLRGTARLRGVRMDMREVFCAEAAENRPHRRISD